MLLHIFIVISSINLELSLYFLNMNVGPLQFLSLRKFLIFRLPLQMHVIRIYIFFVRMSTQLQTSVAQYQETA